MRARRAVVLRVLRISAGGGTYPLELLSQWFQNLRPWLTVTYYEINMMRSATAKIYLGDYLGDTCMLALFNISKLIFGLALHQPIATVPSR